MEGQSNMENHTGKFVVGIVTGALVGTAIALLLAPNTGRETRKVIRGKAGQVATSIRHRRGNHRDSDAEESQLVENLELKLVLVVETY